MKSDPFVLGALFDRPATLHGHQLVYVVLAALLLLIALRYMRRALAPIGTLVGVVAAAAIVAFAIGIALMLLVAALLNAQ